MAGLLDWVDPAREKFIGLLSGMPISQAVRGGVSSGGLLDALKAMPKFDRNAKIEDQSAFWNPGGLLGEAAMIAAMGKAKKGGQIGVNSEFYKGGQFLPSSEFTEKGKMQFPKGLRAGNKAEVEPGVYAERPVDGLRPLIKTSEYDWGKYRATGVLEPYSGWAEFQKNPALLEGAVKDSAAFNSGARWVLDGKYFDIHGKEIP